MVFNVLQDTCTAGDLSVQEAITAAVDMFAGNAKEFYKLNVVEKPFNSKNFASPNSLTEEKHVSKEDLKLVRVIWVDTSGQHRCRVSLFSSFISRILGKSIFLDEVDRVHYPTLS